MYLQMRTEHEAFKLNQFYFFSFVCFLVKKKYIGRGQNHKETKLCSKYSLNVSRKRAINKRPEKRA